MKRLARVVAAPTLVMAALTVASVSAPAAHADDRRSFPPGCTVTMDTDKAGIHGVCYKSTGFKFYLLWMSCVEPSKPIPASIPGTNGPTTPTGRPSAVRCPAGKQIWYHTWKDEHRGQQGGYDYGVNEWN